MHITPGSSSPILAVIGECIGEMGLERSCMRVHDWLAIRVVLFLSDGVKSKFINILSSGWLF